MDGTSGSIYGDRLWAFFEAHEDQVIIGDPIKGFHLKAPVPFGAATSRSDSNYSISDGILGLSNSDMSSNFIHNFLRNDFPPINFYVDYEHCEDDYDWIPTNPSEVYWRFQVESFFVGSVVARNFTAITDSGTTVNYMPSEFLSAFYKELGAEGKERIVS